MVPTGTLVSAAGSPTPKYDGPPVSSDLSSWHGDERMSLDSHDSGQSEHTPSARWWLSAPGREAHFRSISDGIPALMSLVTPRGELEIVNGPSTTFSCAIPCASDSRAVLTSKEGVVHAGYHVVATVLSPS